MAPVFLKPCTNPKIPTIQVDVTPPILCQYVNKESQSEKSLRNSTYYSPASRVVRGLACRNTK